jgi:16S rRNA processing protein RimM
VVALVRGVHGLNGAVRVEVLTDHPERRLVAGAVLHRESDARPLTIATAEAVVDGPGWRVRFREVGSRDQADTLRGVYLEQAVPADEGLGRGEYYWHEVIGTTVKDADGTELGVVQDIYRIGETEVFEVGGGAMAPFDLPAVRAFIRVFAPRRGEIVVDADSLDLRPAKSKTGDPSKPKAPRRRSRKPTRTAADAPETPSADVPEAAAPEAPESDTAAEAPATES